MMDMVDVADLANLQREYHDGVSYKGVIKTNFELISR